jgi:hypothetical protein
MVEELKAIIGIPTCANLDKKGGSSLVIWFLSVWNLFLDKVEVFDWPSGIGVLVIFDTSACDLGKPILFPPRPLEGCPCNC